jgi:hypothetical protein
MDILFFLSDSSANGVRLHCLNYLQFFIGASVQDGVEQLCAFSDIIQAEMEIQDPNDATNIADTFNYITNRWTDAVDNNMQIFQDIATSYNVISNTNAVYPNPTIS